MNDAELTGCLERIDRLIAEIDAFPDPAVRGRAQEIVGCLLEYHGAAVGRLIELVRRSPGGSPAIAQELARDELVSGLLLLYGLHPDDLETRVVGALDRVRPHLQSHGGDVEFLGVDDAVVRLRMQGSCNGCPSSAATIRTRIEQAVYEAAPDVVAIAVEGAVAPRADARGFVPLEQLALK